MCLTWENTKGVAKLYKDGQFTGQDTNYATENFKITAGVLSCFIIFFVFSGLTHTAQQISTMIPGNTCVSPGKTQKE